MSATPGFGRETATSHDNGSFLDVMYKLLFPSVELWLANLRQVIEETLLV